jgi:hypothetical protein
MKGVASLVVNITQPKNSVVLVSHQDKIVVIPKSSKFKNGLDKRGVPGYWIQTNLALTMALILATPGIRFVRRLYLAAMGMLILFSVHVVDLIFEVKKIYMTAYAPIAGQTYASWHKGLISGLNLFFRTFRYEFVPFIVWGGLYYRDLFLKQVAGSLPAVKRNQPCPCGSGKKYKHCCGIISH